MLVNAGGERPVCDPWTEVSLTAVLCKLVLLPRDKY